MSNRLKGISSGISVYITTERQSLFCLGFFVVVFFFKHLSMTYSLKYVFGLCLNVATGPLNVPTASDILNTPFICVICRLFGQMIGLRYIYWA